MIIDLFGIKIMYKDILDVYDSLENGSEMPKPLSSYEKGLEHEIMIKHSEKIRNKVDAFLNRAIPEGDSSTFCGMDGGKLLEARRKKEKDPEFKSINQVVLFNSKCKYEVRNISTDKVKKYEEFCDFYKTTFVGLLFSGIMLYLSSVNGRAKDIATFTVGNRRSTLEQKNQGGCYYSVLPFRNKFDEDESMIDTLNRIDLGFLDLFRHADLEYQHMMNHYIKKWHLKLGDSPFSLNVTIIPPGMFDVSDKYEVELHGVNAGVATYVQYVLATPQSDGSLDLNYQYNIKLFKQEDAKKFLCGIEEAVDLIIDNPEMTFGNILDYLQK